MSGARLDENARHWLPRACHIDKVLREMMDQLVNFLVVFLFFSLFFFFLGL